MQNLSCENEFYLHDNKKSFSQEGFALGLVLKKRLVASRKWLSDTGHINQRQAIRICR